MFYYIAIISWAFLIYWGSSVQASDLPSAPSYTSFVVHLFEYFILGGLLTKLVQRIKSCVLSYKKTLMVVILIGMIYAFSDEIHQIFVSGRHFALIDLLTDAIGLILGSFIFMKLKNFNIVKYS